MQYNQLSTIHSWYKGMSDQIWNVLYNEVSSISSFNLEIQMGWPRTTYQLVLVDANLDDLILKRAYDKQIPTCSLKFLHLFSLKFAWQLIYEELKSLFTMGQCRFKVALYMKPYLIFIIFLNHFSIKRIRVSANKIAFWGTWGE